jgi:hypothetical protein
MAKFVQLRIAGNVLFAKDVEIFEGHVDPFLRLPDFEFEFLFGIDPAWLSTRVSVPLVETVLIDTAVEL